MKRFLYSNYTKFVAALLCIVMITLGAFVAVNGFIRFFHEQDYIYNFEDSYEDSYYISSKIDMVQSIVYQTYRNFYYVDDSFESVTGTDTTGKPIINNRTFEEYLDERLREAVDENVNYYVVVNDKAFTNTTAQSPEELKNTRFFFFGTRDADGIVKMESNHDSNMYPYDLTNPIEDIASYNVNDTVVISANVSDEYAAQCEALWDTQAENIKRTVENAFILLIIALLLFIYLVCVAAKNKDGELKPMWIDNVWTEVHLAIMGVVAVGAVAICALAIDEYQTRHLSAYLTRLISVASAAGGSAVVITSALSLVRKIKCKSFLQTSIIFKVVRWCWRIFVKVCKLIYKNLKTYKNTLFEALTKKTSLISIVSLIVYTCITSFAVLFGLGYNMAFAFWFLVGAIAFGFAIFVLAQRGKDIDAIRKGADAIRNGNLDYKIPELKCSDLKELAENINEIGEGLEKSVSAQVKAERLKTDLITNVSHDLKTPLTSIISYTELLSKVEGLPEEAKDYAAVIAKKSDRLKNLTQDLFDISKVQSGNENIVFEKLDAALLISQSLAERDNEIKASELNFCVKADKELYFSADGRKMSRVVGNLIDNAVKYSLKGTRVFVSAFEKDDKIVIELKNTSAYPLDFDAEEITGRFVRGDESRTDGGNGLGLAIAKSYTEVCGGKFDVILDGDMFKAVIKFDKR